MFNTGEIVRILWPFNESNPDNYTVDYSYQAEAADGLIEQCKLVELESHFAAKYLEKV